MRPQIAKYIHKRRWKILIESDLLDHRCLQKTHNENDSH